MKKTSVLAIALVVALLSLAVGLLWASGGRSMPVVMVKEVRQPETLIITHPASNVHIHSLTVRGAGEIDGQASITLMLNGQPYKTESLGGTVDFQWHGDWYEQTAEIRYDPVNARSGEVLLHYRFHSI